MFRLNDDTTIIVYSIFVKIVKHDWLMNLYSYTIICCCCGRCSIRVAAKSGRINSNQEAIDIQERLLQLIYIKRTFETVQCISFNSALYVQAIRRVYLQYTPRPTRPILSSQLAAPVSYCTSEERKLHSLSVTYTWHLISNEPETFICEHSSLKKFRIFSNVAAAKCASLLISRILY